MKTNTNKWLKRKEFSVYNSANCKKVCLNSSTNDYSLYTPINRKTGFKDSSQKTKINSFLLTGELKHDRKSALESQQNKRENDENR